MDEECRHAGPGALGSDYLGDPAGINNNTQVVGGSCDISGNCRAFFWEKKVLSDLNDLVPADSSLYLIYALGINDAGDIVGFAVEKSTGEIHAYLATPVHNKSSKHSPAPAAPRQVTLPVQIFGVLLQQRLPFGRPGARQGGLR